MDSFNLADVWETVAEAAAERIAQRHGEHTWTWADFDRRAGALGADLLDAGLERQTKVAAYLYNGPEYLETYFAAMKAGLVPVNTNFRYGPEEVAYLLDNADAGAVVFAVEFAPLLAGIRDRLPKVRRWYAVGGAAPAWAVPYDDIVAGDTRTEPTWSRSGDDLLILYTGGTTGMPKGVMWRQDDLWQVLGGGGSPLTGLPPVVDLDELAARIRDAGDDGRTVFLPACPLMHGTGQFSAFIALNGGGCVVTETDRRFSAARLWTTVADYHVTNIAIVGDAFARPMLSELDEHPDAYDLTSVVAINSSGVMWSQEVKDGLGRHLPNTILYDSLGSSEAVGLGASVSGGGTSASTAQFSLGEGARVLGPDDRDVAPGSGEQGIVALPGFIPVGYYKDEAKSAKTFRTVDGVRYTMPGDWASVDADGGIHLLGRGSVVINTGGEKVFPEEVEEVVKRFRDIVDAVCVGVPDERYNEIICAVVEAEPGASVDADALKEFVASHLARYKAPRLVVTVDSIGRSPAGKVDYRALQTVAGNHRQAPADGA